MQGGLKKAAKVLLGYAGTSTEIVHGYLFPVVGVDIVHGSDNSGMGSNAGVDLRGKTIKLDEKIVQKTGGAIVAENTVSYQGIV